jgi:hypothetical protein
MAGLQPGDYEVRLVDNDHVTTLAKSNTFTVACTAKIKSLGFQY